MSVPAFAEDPLRVLRVARFAARFGFAVAPETEALMRAIVASGELATLRAERVWQELARGLMEAQPSRFFTALRGCGALAALLPEVDALFGRPRRGGSARWLSTRAWSACGRSTPRRPPARRWRFAMRSSPPIWVCPPARGRGRAIA